ncbi:MAG: hypothetical protein ACXW20_22460 [Burkholderiales bacterium]
MAIDRFGKQLGERDQHSDHPSLARSQSISGIAEARARYSSQRSTSETLDFDSGFTATVGAGGTWHLWREGRHIKEFRNVADGTAHDAVTTSGDQEARRSLAVSTFSIHAVALRLARCLREH